MGKELTKSEIENNKNEIISLLKSTNRSGINKLIKFLFKSGYFYVYGSFKHHTYKGGLAEHSLGVYKRMIAENTECDRNEIIISALLHDLCKVIYKFPKNSIKYGHGEKSLSILEDFLDFKLTENERAAINFHMCNSYSSFVSKEETEWFNNVKDNPLRRLIHVCDCADAGRYSKATTPLLKGIMGLFGL